MFKYIARRYIASLCHRDADIRICQNASGLITRALSTCMNITEGTMESCDIRNGMRLICECKKSFTTTIGCFLPAGAMYEMPEERGSALFLEHLLFRRASHKGQNELEEYLIDINGKVGTLAKRDMFLFYGTVPSCNVEKLIALFADVIMNGIIYDEDVVREKCVILNELKMMGLDNEKVSMDYLFNVAYQDTALANSIYPKTRVVKNFCTENLINFRNRLFNSCYITMISTGSVSLQELEQIVCKYFINNTEDSQSFLTPDLWQYRFSGAELRYRDDDEESGYVAVGFEGAGSQNEQHHFALKVAKEIVGSWDRSCAGANHNASYLAHCAFNTDMCHMYKSFYHCLAQTTSIWGCYFVCDKLKLEDMMFMLQKEWMRLCTTIIQKQVSRAINQCKMMELMKLNNPLDRFFDIVNTLFVHGYYIPIQQRFLSYEGITADTIRTVGSKYIYDQSPVVVALGRVENLPDYCKIQNDMYLLRY